MSKRDVRKRRFMNGIESSVTVSYSTHAKIGHKTILEDSLE